MSIKLTDTQLVMLSAAAQRDDRCLAPSKNLKGGAAQKVAAKLVAAGLVKEIKAKPGTHVWRRDEEAGQPYTFKLTTAGAKAIAVEESAETEAANEEVGSRATVIAIANPASQQTNPDKSPVDSASDAAPPGSAPRSGTKLAQIIELLQSDAGATLDELIAATDWLPHTTRAALTGLRKRGYPVSRERSTSKRGSTYFIRSDRMVAGGSRPTDGDAIRVDELTNIPVAKPKNGMSPAASRARKAA
jgi:hypothetical protein